MKNVLSTIVAATVLASTAMSADRRAPTQPAPAKQGISDSSAASLSGLSNAVTGSFVGSSQFIASLGDLVGQSAEGSSKAVSSAATHTMEAVVVGFEWSKDGSKALVTLASAAGEFSIELSKASYEVSKNVYGSVEDSVKSAVSASGESLAASWAVGTTVVVTIIDVASFAAKESSKVTSQVAQSSYDNVIVPSAEGSHSVSVKIVEVSGAIIMAPSKLISELISLGNSKNAPVAPTTPARR